MSFREQIKNTITFKKLNIIQREIVLSKTNVQNLEHGIKVVKNIGWDNWVKICQYSERNKNIVRELTIGKKELVNH